MPLGQRTRSASRTQLKFIRVMPCRIGVVKEKHLHPANLQTHKCVVARGGWGRQMSNQHTHAGGRKRQYNHSLTLFFLRRNVLRADRPEGNVLSQGRSEPRIAIGSGNNNNVNAVKMRSFHLFQGRRQMEPLRGRRGPTSQSLSATVARFPLCTPARPPALV